ncbi:MAG: hypothetical protein Q9162_007922, partial [Coniocarpon cinnabarinum]
MSRDRDGLKRLTLLQSEMIAQPSRQQLARVPTERLPAINYARIINPTIPTKAALKKEYQLQQPSELPIELQNPLPPIPPSLKRSVDARGSPVGQQQTLAEDHRGAEKSHGLSGEVAHARFKDSSNNFETATKGGTGANLTRMGTLRQQGQQLILCHTKAGQLIQFREYNLEAGKEERTLLETLRPDENIVQYLTSLKRGRSIFLGYEYCRFTLLEIIHVLKAARFLAIAGCVTGRIALETLRFNRACQLKLFLDGKPRIEPTEALALVLVDCVNQRPHVEEDDRDSISHMRQKHAQKQVFGVENGERVGNVLVDFIEVLLQKSHDSDAPRSHRLLRETPAAETMLPYIELASLGLG